MPKVSRVPRKCEDCPEEFLPTSNRQKRCPACSPKLRRGQGWRPAACIDCKTVFTPTNSQHKRCTPCGEKRTKENRRAYSARNAPPTSRPCTNPDCTNQVPRNGRVYAKYCSTECKPLCSVKECENHIHAGVVCATHKTQRWKNGGETSRLKHKWAPKGSPCVTCGSTEKKSTRLNKYCSEACKTRWMLYDGNPPKEVFCVHCGISLSLELEDGQTRRRRADTKQCRRCRQDLAKYGMTAGQIADRDGTECYLCHTPVDMALRAPDMGCPSVDHWFPRAAGGDNDPENLKLAHLGCNIAKGSSIPEELKTM